MGSFQKAERKRVFLRLAALGPSGSGKTYTGLGLATRLAQQFNLKVAVIDTEHGSATKYADRYAFDTCELVTFSVENYIQAIAEASSGGYKVLVIDSLSHAWAGKGGLLEFVDKTATAMKTANSYAAWGKATPKQQQLIEAMLSFPGHLIVTMRTKMEYIQEKDPQTGKSTIRKVGMQPVQRDGLEYEFDIVVDMDQDHNLVVSKTRFSEIADAVYSKPGEEFFGPIVRWIEGASSLPEQRPAPASAEQGAYAPSDRSYLEQAKAGEDAYLALFPEGERVKVGDELMEQRLGMLRQPGTGSATDDLDAASPETIRKYVEWLRDAYRLKRKEDRKQMRKAS